MGTTAIFPAAPMRAGMYESFYLRAVSREEPVGVWIRHTVHKRRGLPPSGSLWCTVFDASLGRPFMDKLTGHELTAAPGSWIALGRDAEMGPGRAQGRTAHAHWSLRFESQEPELRHLAPGWLYRMPLPRTKLTSPAPDATFDGVVELEGRPAVELHGWPGMVGHNWGSEHAEQWIWLHGLDFEGAAAWVDVALARLRIAGRLTPWVANGALSLDGRRQRIGGLGARGAHVEAGARGCVSRLRGEHGLTIEVRVEVPGTSAAGWRYADPDGSEHDVVNCSVAALQLDIEPAGGGAPRTLRTSHGGAYELGMRTMSGAGEHAHGVPIASFADG